MLVLKEVKEIYKGSTKIRPKAYSGPELCFTANTAGSTVKLNKNGSPTSVSLEINTGNGRSDYTFGDTITLGNAGDKVYMRNKSETPTGFSTANANSYRFEITGSVSSSGDCNYLLCKNSTDTLTGAYCFCNLFYYCSGLTTAPALSATTLTAACYINMFIGCEDLISLPKLQAIALPNTCYRSMFEGCSKIKLSTTQTGEYQTPYRIPTSGTGTVGTNSLYNMFSGTGGTFKGAPTINTTYYTSNTVI